MEEKQSFAYGQNHLSTQIALDIARGKVSGILTTSVIRGIQESHRIVNQIVMDEEVVYGVNTGFGPLCNTLISKEDTERLQENILRSHAVGVGDPTPQEITKLMLILKVHSLAMGKSGISLEILERIIWHIDNDVIPAVPLQGSVGASGDLAPLAHLFLPLLGLGKVWRKNEQIDSLLVLQEHQQHPLKLGPKEGLALINGTQFIAAHAVVVLERLHNCLNNADIIGAMMIEALMGSLKPFYPDLHELRAFPANQHVAHRIHYLLEHSEILASHLDCDRVQDPYSLRCIPQVHGASRASWLHLKELLEIELNSVTDNPIIIDRELTISGGNFHGQPLALPLDYATLAAAELGNIADRRIYLALEGKVDGLPRLLMRDTGINSGFMLCQYTSAALVSENKSLLFPASGDSIPTSLGQEDHVSMGSISGRKAMRVIDNLEKIQAIELLCAAQAFDYRRPLKSGKLLETIHSKVREEIDHAEEDRIFADDIEKAIKIIQRKELLTTLRANEPEHPEFRSAYQMAFENL